MDNTNDKLLLTAESSSVSRVEKEQMNGHKAITLWLTGLSAAGKSTIARYLEELMHRNSIRTIMLDGDNTRMGINKDLDFSIEGRHENIRRVAEIAKLLNDAGVVVIACFISPMRTDRQMARDIVGNDSFIETFIDAPLDLCIERDPKGLYKKAIKGEISDFTGISAPYENPLSPHLHIQTGNTTAAASAQEIWDFLIQNNILFIQQQ